MSYQIHARKSLVILAVSTLTWMSFAASHRGWPRARDIETGQPSGASTKAAVSLASEDSELRSRIADAFDRHRLVFEPNWGQVGSSVRFLSRARDYSVLLTPAQSVLLLSKGQEKAEIDDKSRQRVSGRRFGSELLLMKLAGSNPTAEAVGVEELPGKANYFIGKDPKRWRSDIPTYQGALFRSVYPGIDLTYYGSDTGLEFDFVVRPGADYKRIKVSVEGARRIKIENNGDLVISTRSGVVRQHKPFVYQEVNGVRREVGARYARRGHVIRFVLGGYDHMRPLIIDPVLDYATFVGGTSSDEARSIALDTDGNAYVTGRTFSFNFPISIDSYDTTYANSYDVFVTKLNAAGSNILYSTYLGGNSDDNGFGIAIDSSGNAFVTGSTDSSDYPTTPGAFDTTFHGASFPGDVFVTKLNSAGTALIYSTYIGSSSSEQASAIALDSNGNAYITGYTSSAMFPTTPGAFRTTFRGGGFPSGDAFVLKLNDTGSALVYSTFLGGSQADQGLGIVVDSIGKAFVTGNTSSSDFDVTPGAFQTTYGGGTAFLTNGGDAFVTELNAEGTALIYSTYLGGQSDDSGAGIAINPDGEAFVSGTTASFNFPVSEGVVRVENGGIARSGDAGNQWVRTNSGLTDGNVLSLAIDPVTPTTMYAGTNNAGVFKSSDSGANWTAINSGLTNMSIQALAIDPAMPSILYLGTNGRGVFRSTDSGATWRGINSGENGSSVSALVIDPSDSAVVYAATEAGIFKTVNAGAAWTGISPLNPSFRALAIDPVNNLTLYAGSFGTLYLTRDGGQTWTSVPLVSGSIRTVVVNPLVPSTVYAGTDAGLTSSTDSGVTWHFRFDKILRNSAISAIVPDRLDSSILYAGAASGIFKSTDGGNGWFQSNTGLAGGVVNCLAIDPSTTTTVYAGNAAGSSDGFVARLSAAGSALLYSTYLGGNAFDGCSAIAIDSDNNAYVTGQTGSTNFPVTPGTFQASQFSSDAFVAKLSPDGGSLIYSTYLGGFSVDQGYGIAVNSTGNAFVVGYSTSANFPVTPGAFQTTLSGFSQDAFVAKLSQVPNLSTDLAVTITGPSGTLTAGGFISYNITVTNNGSTRASGPLVVEQLSNNLLFNFCSSSEMSCSMLGDSELLSASEIAPGASIHATVFANVSCSTHDGDTLTNTVTVTSLTPDTVSSNDTAMTSNPTSNPPPVVFPTTWFFPSSGSSSAISVTSTTTCPWSAVSNASWITITSSGTCCNGVVNFSVAPNTGATRVGTLTVAGQTVTVSQFGVPHVLDVTSQNPASGVSISVTPGDLNGQSNGSTPFTRSFAEGTNVTLTAPTTSGTRTFSKWQRNGVDFTTDPTANIVIDADTSMSAVYVSLTPLYQGFLDAAGCGIITGWAWDANQPNSIISVDIFDGAAFIVTLQANLFREDILNAGIGNGFHGFSFTVPQSLKNGQSHSIKAQFHGTSTQLSNSPRTINCSGGPVNYQGYHDGAGCGTISGWAWDANDPNNPINVDIYDGGTLIATVPSIQFRPDLVTAGIGNGFHGFSFTVLSSMKDGQPHAITVKFPGTSTNLNNTPRTITCNGAAPVFQGVHEVANCSVISGWAWDANDPNSPINVAIFSDGQLIATVLAIQFRQDLVSMGIGNGYHAFVFNVPASLKNGQPHSIRVRFSGTTTDLTSTPRSITCSGP